MDLSVFAVYPNSQNTLSFELIDWHTSTPSNQRSDISYIKN